MPALQRGGVQLIYNGAPLAMNSRLFCDSLPGARDVAINGPILPDVNPRGVRFSECLRHPEFDLPVAGKKMKIRCRTMLLLALLSGKVCSADSVNIGVTENIVASPCIFNGGNNNLDVNLGNIQATNMATPGSTSDPVPFSLLFTQCPTGTQSVTVAFTGSPDPEAGADYFMNSGSATHVAIAMRDAQTGALKGTGSSMTQTIAADRTATLAMLASVKSMTGAPRRKHPRGCGDDDAVQLNAGDKPF